MEVSDSEEEQKEFVPTSEHYGKSLQKIITKAGNINTARQWISSERVYENLYPQVTPRIETVEKGSRRLTGKRSRTQR